MGEVEVVDVGGSIGSNRVLPKMKVCSARFGSGVWFSEAYGDKWRCGNAGFRFDYPITEIIPNNENITAHTLTIFFSSRVSTHLQT